jgi:formate hydrogenlyase subunit 6/NADH:ubiquinone oxidoreductase subunit I
MKILLTAIKSFFKKPFTNRYPKQKANIPEDYRGRHDYYIAKCIGCQACVRVCPAKTIHWHPKTKKVTIDLDRCIFCGMCEDICPVNAIKLREKMEPATYKRGENWKIKGTKAPEGTQPEQS